MMLLRRARRLILFLVHGVLAEDIAAWKHEARA